MEFDEDNSGDIGEYFIVYPSKLYLQLYLNN